MGYFDNLKLDKWFKAVTYLGGIVAILSITVPMQAVSNEVMAAVGFGAFLYGVGRWKNEKTFTQFQPGKKISWKERDTDIIGLLFELSGIILVLYAIWNIVRAGF